MASNGRVHPGCVNSANPYHECGVSCLEKIAKGQGQKEKKKSGNRYGVKMELSKKTDGGRKTDRSCPNASNPYHECNKYCSHNSYEANHQGVDKKSAFLNLDSPGRKKKLSESKQKTEKVANSVSVVNSAYPNGNASPQSPYTIEQKIEFENTQSFSLHPLEDSHSRNHLFKQGRVQPPEVAPPDGSKISLSSYAETPPIKQDEDEEIYMPLKRAYSPVAKKVEKHASGPTNNSMDFSLSGISPASKDSNGNAIRSVISDSCVTVGKYHVRESVASILKLIFEKYGDIAANCRLQSTSLHTYYLECLCSVVQELQSTPFKQLTKSKIKEMLAVLKDVESAGIDVSWLHSIFDELTEAMVKDLAEKEREVADIKEQISEATARLNELEVESSELNNTLQSIKSKAKKIRFKPLGEEV